MVRGHSLLGSGSLTSAALRGLNDPSLFPPHDAPALFRLSIGQNPNLPRENAVRSSQGLYLSAVGCCRAGSASVSEREQRGLLLIFPQFRTVLDGSGGQAVTLADFPDALAQGLLVCGAEEGMLFVLLAVAAQEVGEPLLQLPRLRAAFTLALSFTATGSRRFARLEAER